MSRLLSMDVTLLYLEGSPNWKIAYERLRRLAIERPNVLVRHQLVETLQRARSQMGLTSRRYWTPVRYEGARKLEQAGRVIADA